MSSPKFDAEQYLKKHRDARHKKYAEVERATILKIVKDARRIVFGAKDDQPPKRYEGVAKSDSTAATLAGIASPQSGRVKRHD